MVVYALVLGAGGQGGVKATPVRAKKSMYQLKLSSSSWNRSSAGSKDLPTLITGQVTDRATKLSSLVASAGVKSKRGGR